MAASHTDQRKLVGLFFYPRIDKSSDCVGYDGGMRFNPDIHHRQSIRLRGYDYASPGAYYVTIVAKHRECLFGDVVDGHSRLNPAGRAVWNTWVGLPMHYPSVFLDAFIIMPNHVHAIIWITHDHVGAGFKPAPTGTGNITGLSEIVRAFKTFSSRRVNTIRATPGSPVWQRNYHERVIRTEAELNRVREYIIDNPRNWETDDENQRPA